MPDRPTIVIAKLPPRSPRNPRKAGTPGVSGVVQLNRAQAAADHAARGDLADAMFVQMRAAAALKGEK